MTTATEPLKERRRRYWRWSGYLTGGFFLLLFAIPPSDDRDEGAAYALGAFVGALAVPLLIALVLRLAYVKLIRRDGRPIWSPWLLVIGAVIALMARAGELNQENA